MSLAEHSEILSSLASVREDVWRHVEALDRYRAVKAIEKTIADFAALDDLTGSLTNIRDSMQERLGETREYRALRTVEKMIPELTSVLVLLSEWPDGVRQQAPGTDEGATGSFASDHLEAIPHVPSDVPVAHAGNVVEMLEVAETITLATAAGSDEASAVENRNEDFDRIANDPDLESIDRETADHSRAESPPAQPQSASPPIGDGAPASSLAYSLAQLMVQALVPPPPTSPEGTEGDKKETNEPVLPANHSETQRAGRAA